ncbi:MAG: SIMPL domain-containing protein [Bacteroidota bacterium]
METKLHTKEIILGLSLLIGLSLLGLFINKGLKTFSDKDRVVTVKGLAEMNMTATSATITLSFAFSGDNLQDILKQTEIKKNAIAAYLKNIGYEKVDIQINNIGITDHQKYYEPEWQGGQQVQRKIDRYITNQSITLQSKDVKATEDKSSQIALDLVSKDLTAILTTNYSFPDLNSIKPKLIAESTKNARISGEQFANDSQATLGKIKTASQGQISIAGKYNYNEDGSEVAEKPKEPYIQKARVVSTIVFFLE